MRNIEGEREKQINKRLERETKERDTDKRKQKAAQFFNEVYLE
jgi:hypothetical protein